MAEKPIFTKHAAAAADTEEIWRGGGGGRRETPRRIRSGNFKIDCNFTVYPSEINNIKLRRVYFIRFHNRFITRKEKI